MKRLLLCGTTVCVLLVAVAFSGSQPATKPAAPANELQVEINGRNPWTHLRLNNEPTEFRLAIVSDRTGGHRGKIACCAIDQLNLRQPESVVSAGDLIEGYKEEPDKVATEWREFQSYVHRLHAVLLRPRQSRRCQSLTASSGRRSSASSYYHFSPRCASPGAQLNDAGKNEAVMSPEQIAWAKKVLEQNCRNRWTIVPCTTRCGRWRTWRRPGFASGARWANGPTRCSPGTCTAIRVRASGPQLLSTGHDGGGSKLRAPLWRVRSHCLITMKKDGPTIASRHARWHLLPKTCACP